MTAAGALSCVLRTRHRCFDNLAKEKKKNHRRNSTRQNFKIKSKRKKKVFLGDISPRNMYQVRRIVIKKNFIPSICSNSQIFRQVNEKSKPVSKRLTATAFLWPFEGSKVSANISCSLEENLTPPTQPPASRPTCQPPGDLLSHTLTVSVGVCGCVGVPRKKDGSWSLCMNISNPLRSDRNWYFWHFLCVEIQIFCLPKYSGGLGICTDSYQIRENNLFGALHSRWKNNL